MDRVTKRIGHTKSRTGCTQCKKRHRKCDESHPTCDGCRKSGLRCSFTQLEYAALSGVPKIDSRQIHCGYAYPPSFSLEDMGLLHHFIISTSMVLLKDRNFQRFWQTTGVEISLKDPFLLHSLLALSALHLAQTASGNTQSYFQQASRHHDIALTSYQQALQDLDPAHYDSLFLSAFLLFIYVFAYIAGNPLEAQLPEVDATEVFLSFRWVHIARGIRAVRKQGMDHLLTGRLKTVFGPTMSVNDSNLDDPPSPFDKSLSTLSQMWESDEKLTPERKELYSKALDNLIGSYRRSFQREQHAATRRSSGLSEDLVHTVRWFADLPDAFVRLFEQHDPPALILMCYHAKLMDNASFSFWWSHRNSQICFSRVERILDPKWYKYLKAIQ